MALLAASLFLVAASLFPPHHITFCPLASRQKRNWNCKTKFPLWDDLTLPLYTENILYCLHFRVLFTQLSGFSFLLIFFRLFYSERASEAPFGKCPELTPRAFFMWKSKLEPGRNVFQTIPTKEMFPRAEHSPRYKTKDAQHLLPSFSQAVYFCEKVAAENITLILSRHLVSSNILKLL